LTPLFSQCSSSRLLHGVEFWYLLNRTCITHINDKTCHVFLYNFDYSYCNLYCFKVYSVVCNLYVVFKFC